MASIEKTVFISYRRTDVYIALAVYENLKNNGYDAFFDYRSISSGDFEQIITSNIRARAHFLLILTPTALDRLNEPGDWLRREIEIAIEEKRNIIPLFFKGFRFGTPSLSDALTGKLRSLSRYNGLNVHEDYFDEAMHRLRTQYLNIPLDTVLHPVSNTVQKIVREEKYAADKALEQIEDVQELVKQPEEKPDKPKAEPASSPVDFIPVTTSQKQPNESKHAEEKAVDNKNLPKPSTSHPIKIEPASHRSRNAISWRTVISLVSLTGGLFLIVLCTWSGISLWNNLVPATPTLEPTETLVPPVPPTPIDTMIGNDGMTMVYVPASEFTMGSKNGDPDVKPIHTVYLDTFWIDQTEVTNAMYANCVSDGKCDPPNSTKSSSQDNYFGNSQYDNFPVIYVSWEDANAYCSWVGRRLPTEAEWEKAARDDDRRTYPWGDDTPSDRLLNYDNNIADTTEAGNYPNGASPYDALDMAGNVWEWVADWYSDTYYASSQDANPLGPDSGQYRVLRGGAWDSFNDSVRSANREGRDPTDSNHFIGFRCALTADAEAQTAPSTPLPTISVSCNVPLINKPELPDTNIQILNNTNQPTTVSLYLNETSSGECGYAAYNIPGNLSTSAQLPIGCYWMYAFINDSDSSHEAEGFGCVNNTAETWSIVIDENSVVLQNP